MIISVKIYILLREEGALMDKDKLSDIKSKSKDDDEMFLTFDQFKFNYKEIFEKSPAALLILKYDQIIAMNNACASMLQIDMTHEFHAMNPGKVSPEYQPDGKKSSEKAKEMLKLADLQGSYRFEWTHKKMDGNEFPVEVQLISLGNKTNIYMGVWHDITVSKRREEKLLLLKSELEEIIRSRTQELENSIAEIKFMQEQLLETKKLASLTDIVIGVSHELSTPIGIGMTNATYLDHKLIKFKELFESEKLTKHQLEDFLKMTTEATENITRNLMKASELINSFKGMRIDSDSKLQRQITYKEFLDDIRVYCAYDLHEHNIELITEVDESLIYFGDSVAFFFIMQNLIRNSLDHGLSDLKKGKIQIDVVKGDEYVKVRYQDNGKGMCEAEIENF